MPPLCYYADTFRAMPLFHAYAAFRCHCHAYYSAYERRYAAPAPLNAAMDAADAFSDATPMPLLLPLLPDERYGVMASLLPIRYYSAR